MSDRMSENMPEGMLDIIDIISEYMSDRMSSGGDHSKKVILAASPRSIKILVHIVVHG